MAVAVAEGEEAEDDDTASTKKDGLGIAHSSLSVSSQLGTAAAIQYNTSNVSWLLAMCLHIIIRRPSLGSLAD